MFDQISMTCSGLISGVTQQNQQQQLRHQQNQQQQHRHQQ